MQVTRGYFITAFDQRWMDNTAAWWNNKPVSSENGSTATFGWFADRDRALEAVRRNAFDMHECLYVWLVVECLQEGIHPARVSDERIWFRWDGDSIDGRWVETARPDAVKRMVGFAIG